jgi:plasmid stabilization system protein ParE
MRYSVEYTARAERDLSEAYAYIARGAPLNAARWLDTMEAAVEGLREFPERCTVARESRLLGQEIRQLVVGGYRVLFQVRGRRVLVLHVRHGKRRTAQTGDLRTN